jgi:hypothetical protein
MFFYNETGMKLFSKGYFKITAFVFIALMLMLTLPRLNRVAFPPVAEPSPFYDCDDATLTMYRHFRELGIESTPIVGNLDIEGEAYEMSDHVWLLVKSGDIEIAYDWGLPRFDRQHYEGYTISLDYLLYAVEEDYMNSGSSITAAR